MRPTLGGYQPIHQNGALPPLQKDGKTASDRAKFSAREGNQGHEDDTLTDGLG